MVMLVVLAAILVNGKTNSFFFVDGRARLFYGRLGKLFALGIMATE